MPSTWETIVTALETLLEGALDAEVERDIPLPTSIPDAGLVILREEEATEPVEVMLSPLAYSYEQPFSIEVFASGDSRVATWDSIKVAIGAALGSNRTLGGLCEWIEMLPPEGRSEPFQGAHSIKAGIIPLTIAYETSNPLT